MSLVSLCRSKGTTHVLAAAALGLDPALLERADAGRQPLPRSVAVRLARLLGSETATVLAEVPRMTRNESPDAFRPVPGRPGFEPIFPKQLAGDVPVPSVRPDYPQVWSAVQDGEDDAWDVRTARFDGSARAPVAVPGAKAPRYALLFGGRIWSFASASISGSLRVAYAVDPVAGALAALGSHDFDRPTALVGEPSTGTLWVAEAGGRRLRRLDQTNGNPDATLDVFSVEPVAAAAAGGLLYVLAHLPLDPAVAVLLECDPVSLAVLRSNNDSLFANARGIDASEDGTRLWIVAAAPTPRLVRVDAASLDVDSVAVPDGLVDPAHVRAGEGRLWISDVSAGGSARLVRFDPATGESAAHEYPSPDDSGVPAGRLGFDGAYLWLPNPQGRLSKVNPNTLGSVLQVGAAYGAWACACVLGPA